MDPDTITDTQIHEVETLRYKGDTLLDVDPYTITDTQIHEHDVRYNVPNQREGNG